MPVAPAPGGGTPPEAPGPGGAGAGEAEPPPGAPPTAAARKKKRGRPTLGDRARVADARPDKFDWVRPGMTGGLRWPLGAAAAAEGRPLPGCLRGPEAEARGRWTPARAPLALQSLDPAYADNPVAVATKAKAHRYAAPTLRAFLRPFSAAGRPDARAALGAGGLAKVGNKLAAFCLAPERLHLGERLHLLHPVRPGSALLLHSMGELEAWGGGGGTGFRIQKQTKLECAGEIAQVGAGPASVICQREVLPLLPVWFGARSPAGLDVGVVNPQPFRGSEEDQDFVKLHSRYRFAKPTSHCSWNYLWPEVALTFTDGELRVLDVERMVAAYAQPGDDEAGERLGLCAYGCHPKVLLRARGRRLARFDTRADRDMLVYDVQRHGAACNLWGLAPASTEVPFDHFNLFAAATEQAVMLFDERWLQKPLLTWENTLEGPPHALNTFTASGAAGSIAGERVDGFVVAASAADGDVHGFPFSETYGTGSTTRELLVDGRQLLKASLLSPFAQALGLPYRLQAGASAGDPDAAVPEDGVDGMQAVPVPVPGPAGPHAPGLLLTTLTRSGFLRLTEFRSGLPEDEAAAAAAAPGPGGAAGPSGGAGRPPCAVHPGGGPCPDESDALYGEGCGPAHPKSVDARARMRELPVHDRWALAVKPARFWDPLPGAAGRTKDEAAGAAPEGPTPLFDRCCAARADLSAGRKRNLPTYRLTAGRPRGAADAWWGPYLDVAYAEAAGRERDPTGFRISLPAGGGLNFAEREAAGDAPTEGGEGPAEPLRAQLAKLDALWHQPGPGEAAAAAAAAVGLATQGSQAAAAAGPGPGRTPGAGQARPDPRVRPVFGLRRCRTCQQQRPALQFRPGARECRHCQRTGKGKARMSQGGF